MSDLTELLMQYENLHIAADEIEEQKKIIAQQIKEEFQKQGATKSKKLSQGYISIGQRKNWTFSPAVQDIKDDLKKLEAEEKKSGIATYDVSEYIMYKKTK